MAKHPKLNGISGPVADHLQYISKAADIPMEKAIKTLFSEGYTTHPPEPYWLLGPRAFRLYCQGLEMRDMLKGRTAAEVLKAVKIQSADVAPGIDGADLRRWLDIVEDEPFQKAWANMNDFRQFMDELAAAFEGSGVAGSLKQAFSRVRGLMLARLFLGSEAAGAPGKEMALAVLPKKPPSWPD